MSLASKPLIGRQVEIQEAPLRNSVYRKFDAIPDGRGSTSTPDIYFFKYICRVRKKYFNKIQMLFNERIFLRRKINLWIKAQYLIFCK
ncbi:hypothetical protein X734_06635 [Mesorhizobium sp. L2C084A000]|nr:hypothetical protein X734_06635 [Mesorhizobium sp. L2C084A000]